jgi:hypothetical protein
MVLGERVYWMDEYDKCMMHTCGNITVNPINSVNKNLNNTVSFTLAYFSDIVFKRKTYTFLILVYLC